MWDVARGKEHAVFDAGECLPGRGGLAWLGDQTIMVPANNRSVWTLSSPVVIGGEVGFQYNVADGGDCLNIKQLSKRCSHLAGKGGAKTAVRKVLEKLPDNKFVRTDIRNYYASIQHEVLFKQMQEQFEDQGLLDLLWQ